MTMPAVPHPRVSICIPTYNGRVYLQACLASVQSQTFKDFEVLICDDQSSDGTLDFARELVQGDARFRFIKNPRRFGLVGNWNNCIELARGEWIKFVFQDDIIAPACVEKLLLACEQSGKNFGFCARAFIFDDAVAPWMRDWFVGHKQRLQADYQSGRVISPDSAALTAIREPAHNMVGEPTVTLISKAIFCEFGKFDEALIQLCDTEFWSRVMVNQGAAFVPESLATFRIHARAATALNHGARAYRMSVLDPLILRYRFAFGRHFKLVRDPQLTRKSILSLRLECALAATDAWRLAGQGAAAKSQTAFNALAEWQMVAAHCPGLKALAIVGRVIKFFRRVKHGIARRLSWQH
jgi:glycosyltransferase involved in cell wall biosynthesis